LYLPPTYNSSKRYPLLILTHATSNEQRFSLDGGSSNFAAQPTASREIVVLVVNELENLTGVLGSPAEFSVVQSGYESSIDYLSDRGIIDRARVGIQGWSRSGLWVSFLLTHSQYEFAAASLTESLDNGWWSYLCCQNVEAELSNGAAPFGGGFDSWRRLAPSFNLDQIRTPVFMWNQDPTSLWDWYIGLRRLGKPVEYWGLPSATHELTMLGQRLRANELLVDWFDFWLNGREDMKARKRPQYARWREFRIQASEAR